MDTSKLVDKARQCVERRNYDYAIEQYMQALTLNPSDVNVRKELRAVQRRRVKEDGSGGFGKFLGKIKTFAISSKGDPDKRIVQCENILKDDPDSTNTLIALGKACFDGGYRDAAVWVFGDLRNSHPTNVNILRILQDVYRQTNQMDKALEVNQAILQIVPRDRDASEALKNISATSMSQQIEGKTARQIVKDSETDARMDLSERGLRTADDVGKAIRFTEEDIRKRPEDVDLQIKLGDLYKRLKDWAAAKVAYDKALELSPSEYRTTVKMDELKLDQMKEHYQAVAAKAKSGDTAAKAAYKKLYNEFMAFRLQSFEQREHHYITDIGIAYDLGQIYYAFKRYDDAIVRFQRTIKDPKRRAQSALRLGQCFGSKGQHDLAIRQLTEGIDALEIMSDMKKELLYTRGVTCAAKGDAERAKKDFLTIYEIDISYKDVAQKIEV